MKAQFDFFQPTDALALWKCRLQIRIKKDVRTLFAEFTHFYEINTPIMGSALLNSLILTTLK